MPPHYPDNPLAGLAALDIETDAVLDLRGLEASAALTRLKRSLDGSVADGRGRYRVHFDPAGDDGKETLFIPVGRFLLEARREGRLRRCLPLQSGDGYFVELTNAKRAPIEVGREDD